MALAKKINPVGEVKVMASYSKAILWVVQNDDLDWVDGEDGTAGKEMSVTAALIADLFDKPDTTVRKDILKCREKEMSKIRLRVAQGMRGNNY